MSEILLDLGDLPKAAMGTATNEDAIGHKQSAAALSRSAWRRLAPSPSTSVRFKPERVSITSILSLTRTALDETRAPNGSEIYERIVVTEGKSKRKKESRFRQVILTTGPVERGSDPE